MSEREDEDREIEPPTPPEPAPDPGRFREGAAHRLQVLAELLTSTATRLQYSEEPVGKIRIMMRTERKMMAAYTGISSARFVRLMFVASVEEASKLGRGGKPAKAIRVRSLVGYNYPELAALFSDEDLAGAIEAWASKSTAAGSAKFDRLAAILRRAWKGRVAGLPGRSLKSDWFKHRKWVRMWLPDTDLLSEDDLSTEDASED